MRVPALQEEEKRYLDSMLAGSAYDPERLLLRASQVLSGATRYAAAATTPSGATARVKGVQLVQTSRRTAMLLMMSTAGTMKSRVFHCDFDLTSEMLRVFFRVFNQKVTAGRWRRSPRRSSSPWRRLWGRCTCWWVPPCGPF